MRSTTCLGALAACLLAAPGHAQHDAAADAPDSLVAATPTFAFHSDFSTNLHDALITASTAARRAQQASGPGGPEQTCFNELAPEERSGWDRAVEYYAGVIGSASWNAREQTLIRTDLARLREGWSTSADDQAFINNARNARATAVPAYAACQWPAQDATNRRWVEIVAALLASYEPTLVARLEQLYQKSLDGLPIRIDVVELANGNANTIVTSPTGGHILISSSNDGIQNDAALEMVFHEASHLLTATWRDDPLPAALEQAASQLDAQLPGDLWHVVLFYVTGEAVRETLANAGEAGYRPYVYAQGLFERGGGGRWSAYRRPIESAWPTYLEGERTLADAALATVEALRD